VPNTIHIVVGECGQYSDWALWIVAAFSNLETAEQWRDGCQAYADSARELCYDIHDSYVHLREEFRAAWEAGPKALGRAELIKQARYNPYDPHMRYYDHVKYQVLDFPLDPDTPDKWLGVKLGPLVEAVREFERENDATPDPKEFDELAAKHGVTKDLGPETKARLEAELVKRGLIEENP